MENIKSGWTLRLLKVVTGIFGLASIFTIFIYNIDKGDWVFVTGRIILHTSLVISVVFTIFYLLSYIFLNSTTKIIKLSKQYLKWFSLLIFISLLLIKFGVSAAEKNLKISQFIEQSRADGVPDDQILLYLQEKEAMD